MVTEIMKFQVFSPIDRKFPIFELLDDDDKTILDISKNDIGVIEVSFNGNISSRVYEISVFLKFLKEGLELAGSSVETGFEGYGNES